MSTDLAVVDVPEVRLSNSDLELIRRQVNIPRGGRPPTDQDLDGFGRYCMAQRLNPFDRQIYLAYIGGRWQPFTGVHGRLVIALRTGAVDGMEGPYYCHRREGVERNHPPDWDELWDDNTPPHAAKFVVYRKGWTRFPVGVARWQDYNKGTGSWQSNPPLMLGYKAITRALNLVFPDVMPPAPDRAEDDVDVDESIGYSRSEPPPVEVVDATTATTNGGPMVDARGLPAEYSLTSATFLVSLRRLAGIRNEEPPTSLNAVSADLIEAWRSGQATEEEPF
jgi:hypothetical protein